MFLKATTRPALRGAVRSFWPDFRTPTISHEELPENRLLCQQRGRKMTQSTATLVRDLSVNADHEDQPHATSYVTGWQSGNGEEARMLRCLCSRDTSQNKVPSMGLWKKSYRRNSKLNNGTPQGDVLGVYPKTWILIIWSLICICRVEPYVHPYMKPSRAFHSQISGPYTINQYDPNFINDPLRLIWALVKTPYIKHKSPSKRLPFHAYMRIPSSIYISSSKEF